MSFVACSGSQLRHINEGEPGNPDRPPQIDQIGKVDIMTLSIGGNNLGFADIITNCIYRPAWSTDYGPEYPNNTGSCYKSIQSARDNIDRFEQYIRGTLQDTLRRQRDPDWNRNDFDFYLFLLGYAHYFNVDTTECNTWSFGLWPIDDGKHKPKLTLELRRALKDLVQAVNDMYRGVVNQVSQPYTHTQFVDISPGFDGHRFCEKDISFYGNYHSKDVWIWNASPDTPPDWKDPDKPEDRIEDHWNPMPGNSLDPAWVEFLESMGTDIPGQGIGFGVNPGNSMPWPQGSGGKEGRKTRVFHPKQVSLR